jgi:hypothetical protein
LGRFAVIGHHLVFVVFYAVSAIGDSGTTFYAVVTTDPTGFTKYNLVYFQKMLQ